jgi:hypothetical protein
VCPDFPRIPPPWPSSRTASASAIDDRSEARKAGQPVEVLAFERSLVDAADFGTTLAARVAKLSTARHALFANKDLGMTPVTVRLSPGTYSLKVQVGNAKPRVIPIQIRVGVQSAQYLELQSR